MADSVQVAVRVRPFNGREKELKSQRCLFMNGKTTTIKDLAADTEKTFAFDYSYDSFCPDDACYANQKMVFDDLGENVLKNAWEGFNCSLFAYGQTGSGKSYSVVGYGEAKGIVPLTCEEMFRRIETSEDPNKSFFVTVSMLEIYNEKIADLLVSRDKQPKGGLSVRETPKGGVFIKDLSDNAVGNYKEIEAKMEQGTNARTVAATQMNATSSRAHTVFIVKFKQTTKGEGGGKDLVKDSKINLVDLAGSERSSKTGATGDRLKEGANINKSLTMLGLVIHALAEASSGSKKAKKVHVPYRDSKLTHLLKESLGGNSKTIMIAALSPADNNYEETLSTLRYADSAKRIKNKAVVNENPTDKLIRELKEEIARMKEGGAVAVAGAPAGGADTEDMKRMQETIEANEKMLEEMNKTWEQKLAESQARSQEVDQTLAKSGIGQVAVDKSCPHLVNLNEDPLMAGALVYYVQDGMTHVGSKAPESDDEQAIVLKGLNVKPEHCVFTRSEKDDPDYKEGEEAAEGEPEEVTLDGKIHSVLVKNLPGSKMFVNGNQLEDEQEVELHQGDRILIGNSQMFRMNHPQEALHMFRKRARGELSEEEMNPQVVDFSKAQEEIARAQGQMQAMEEQQEKMRQEEEKRRVQYEAQLKAMEEKMKKEQEEAMAKLEAQKKEFEQKMAKGEGVSSEIAKLREEEEKMVKQQEEAQIAIKAEQDAMTKRRLMEARRAREEAQVQEQLLKLLPKVTEVNDIAKMLNKPIEFKAQLRTVIPEAKNLSPLEELRQMRKIETGVQALETKTNAHHDWSYDKFMNRYFMIQEVFQTFQSDGEVPVMSNDDDPFYDPPEAYCIGKAHVYLEALAYLLDIQEWIPIVDYRGVKGGEVRIEMVPVDDEGDPDNVEFVDSPEEMVGQKVNIEIRVVGVRGISPKYMDLYVSHTFYDEEEGRETEHVMRAKAGGVADFNYKRLVTIPKVTEDHLEFFQKDAVTFEVMGYIDIKAGATLAQIKALQKNKDFSATELEMTQGIRKEAIDSKLELAQEGRDLIDDGGAAPEKKEKKEKKKKKREKSEKNLKALTEEFEEQVESAASSGAQVCTMCEEEPAVWTCEECGDKLCDDCDAVRHRKPARATHHRKPLGGTKQCGACQEEEADVDCKECGQALCDDCDMIKHRKAAKAAHVRTRLPNRPEAPASPQPAATATPSQGGQGVPPATTTVAVVGDGSDGKSKACLVL